MDYTGTDFYCDVALRGTLPLRVEYESEHVLAYHHTKPYWPVHIVVLPKKHIDSFTSLSIRDVSILVELTEVLQKIASKIETEHGAARILTHLGQYQDSKHLHFHVSFGDAKPTRSRDIVSP